jgi:glycosyltransferase involved in cell wall biosynthesis
MPLKLSAIIPAYNRPHLLREAIASAWKQTGSAFDEIVITDDLGSSETLPAIAQFVGELGSDDATAAGANPVEATARKLASRLKYSANPRRLGGVANWNRGLELASGDWVTVLHEDDLLLPNFLQTVLPHIGVGVAAIAVRVVRGRELTEAKVPPCRGRAREYPPQYFLKSAMTPFPGVLLSGECARALGGFDSGWGALADYEFWYRVSGYGKIICVEVPAAFYRESAEQWTTRAWPEMLRQALRLRRQIAREQFPLYPRWGKWTARFFTLRNAHAYFRRYGLGSSKGLSTAATMGGATDASTLALVRRFQRLQRLPLSWLPSGWVWASVRLMTLWERRRSRSANRTLPRRFKIGLHNERHA